MRESSEEQPFDQMDDSGLSVPAMQEESPGLMYGQSYTSEHGVDDFPQSSSEAATQGLSWNYLRGNEFASLHQEDASFPRDATTMRSQKKRVIIIDRWRLLRGPLSAWLNAFNLEFQPIVVPSIQAASEYQAEATPAAVVLCAQPASCDQSWLDAQIAYLRNKVSDLPIVVIGDGTDAVVSRKWSRTVDCRATFRQRAAPRLLWRRSTSRRPAAPIIRRFRLRLSNNRPRRPWPTRPFVPLKIPI